MGAIKICVLLSVIAIISSKPINVQNILTNQDIASTSEAQSLNNDVVTETVNLERMIRNQIRPGIRVTSYNIELTPNVDEGTFEGNAIIDVLITNQDTREDPVLFYARNLEVASVRFSLGGPNQFDADFHVDDGDGILEINSGIPGSVFTFYIEYTGHLTSVGRAFYTGTYDDNTYLAMNLNPTYARHVFPCMDEPTEESNIRFTYNDLEYNTVISNSRLDGDDGTNQFVALTGPPMVWGMIAHNFININIPTANVHLHARPGLSNQDAQASVAINFYFNHLNEWTNKNYFDIIVDQDGRMNVIALPDVSTDWRALSTVAIWEPYLMMEINHSVKQRKTALYEIGVAMAKQWFGYVLIPENWRYEWVISGLASYAAIEMMKLFQSNSIGEDITLLDVNTLFVTDIVQESLLRDAYDGTEGLEPGSDLFNENEIRFHVNGLIKLKAPAILRMLRNVLGNADQDFIQSAAGSLLNRETLQAVNSLHLVDLINSNWLDEGSDLIGNVHDFLDSWKFISGYPLIYVSWRQGGIHVTQEHFTFGEQQLHNYQIPLSFTTSVVPNFMDIEPAMVIDGSFTLPVIISPEDWVIFNIQGQGYYRVNYDDRLWENLIETLADPEQREIIHPLNRATLVDDALNLARAGKIPYDIAFRVVLTMEHETEYAVWKAFIRNMEFLRKRLLSYSADLELDPDIYVRMVRRTIITFENELGFQPEENLAEPAMDTLTRGLVMEHACKANHDSCIAAAVDWFYDPNNGEVVNPNIPYDLRPAVYCTMVREGDEAVIEALEERLEIEPTLYERVVILESMACSQNADFLVDLLQGTIAEDTPYSVEERSKILAAVIRSSYENTLIALNFMSSHTTQIIDMYGGREKFEPLLLELAENIADIVHATEFRIWINSQNNNLDDSWKVTQRAMSLIEQNLNWDANHLEEVYEWIDENDAATMVLSFAAIFLSIIVTVLNH